MQDMKKQIWYVAGPMSGIPQFNFPLFEEVTIKLRKQGYIVVSPVELDEPDIYEQAINSPDGDPSNMPNGRSWGDFLSRDVKVVADMATAVCLLPGWQDSRGACLEASVAMLCGHPLGRYNMLTEVIDGYAANTAFGQMFNQFVEKNQ